MPVTTSYPGIYIQELPVSTHTIAPAPTSIAVFVGYVHPFKTDPSNFGTALEVFSFSDYERLFGGFYQSGYIDANVAFAVNEFFLNGGTDAFVVGLKPTEYVGGASTLAITAENHTFAQSGGVGIKVTALEPTDTVAMSIFINNVQKDGSGNFTIADLSIVYGNRTEVYRKISLDSSNRNPNYLNTRINGVSGLIGVSPNSAYPAAFSSATFSENATLSTTVPSGTVGVFKAADFQAVFQADSSLDKVRVFNLLVTPGVVDNGVLSDALAFCERKLAFLIMDPPPEDVADPPNNYIADFINIAPLSANGALYFPYLKSTNPITGLATDPVSGTPFTLPPSGFVAGMFARTDSNRGVWKAPAGLETIVRDTTGVVAGGVMTEMRHGVLNSAGVNCIRSFSGTGTVVFGARTLVSSNPAFQQWRYVPVRRMALFLEQTLKQNLPWVIFEPNDEPLWIAIRTSIEGFMLSLFHQGAFAGTKPSDSFQVKCDSTTTTPDDVNNGIVNIVVAFAPLKPAEFVIVKIAQLAGQVQS